MEITGRHTYQADFATVWGMLADPATMKARYEGLGHRDVSIVESSGDATSEKVSMKVHRTVDVDIPDLAKKVLKPTAVCVQLDEWWVDGDGRGGRFKVETKNQPVEINGKTRLWPGEGATTEFEVTLEVKVKVPMIGGKIAGVMRGDAEKLMRDEFAWNDQRLAQITGQ